MQKFMLCFSLGETHERHLAAMAWGRHGNNQDQRVEDSSK